MKQRKIGHDNSELAIYPGKIIKFTDEGDCRTCQGNGQSLYQSAFFSHRSILYQSHNFVDLNYKREFLLSGHIHGCIQCNQHLFIPRRPEKTREDPKRPEKTQKDPKRPEKTHLFIPRRPEKTHLFIPRRPEKTRKDPKRHPKRPKKTRKDIFIVDVSELKMTRVMLLYNKIKKVMGVLSPKNGVVVGKNGNGKFTLATAPKSTFTLEFWA